MSTNKTIGGLSVLSSANIKGCYSLPVWNSDAQTTQSACITDILAGVQSLYVLGSGTCSSLRCGVGNTVSGNYSASLSGQCNIVQGNNTSVSGYLNQGLSSFSPHQVLDCLVARYGVTRVS